jgi:thioredoxin reductase (NADPH)
MFIEKDVAIIGAGPTGLFAAFECGMMGLSSVVIDTLAEVGGQCTALYPEKPIYDVAGFPAISASELIDNLHKQAEKFSPTYVLNTAVNLFTGTAGDFTLNDNIKAKAVIIAAGAGAFGPNRPPLANIEQYEKIGRVRYMVKSKADYAGKSVVIAGGGDSAVDWAIALADIASKVYLVHRRDKFRCHEASEQQLKELAAAGKIEMVVPYQLSAIDEKNITVETLDGQKRDLEADFLLAFFGLSMDLGAIANWGLNLDSKHINAHPTTLATNIEGVFAIGDVATYENKLKLIVCGFSEAAMAANSAYKIARPGVAHHFEYSTSKFK